MKPTVIKKSDKGCIQVVGTEYKGVQYIDVRNFYLSEGEFKPTPKGLMVPLDKVEAVAAAMLKQLTAVGKAVDALENPKMYAVLAASRANAIGKKELRVASYRVFDTFADARAFPKSKVKPGDVIMAIVGNYELKGEIYVFEPTSRKRRVAVRTLNESGTGARWVKPENS